MILLRLNTYCDPLRWEEIKVILNCMVHIEYQLYYLKIVGLYFIMIKYEK